MSRKVAPISLPSDATNDVLNTSLGSVNEVIQYSFLPAGMNEAKELLQSDEYYKQASKLMLKVHKIRRVKKDALSHQKARTSHLITNH